MEGSALARRRPRIRRNQTQITAPGLIVSSVKVRGSRPGLQRWWMP